MVTGIQAVFLAILFVLASLSVRAGYYRLGRNTDKLRGFFFLSAGIVTMLAVCLQLYQLVMCPQVKT